jgi:hypothetical protein
LKALLNDVSWLIEKSILIINPARRSVESAAVGAEDERWAAAAGMPTQAFQFGDCRDIN